MPGLMRLQTLVAGRELHFAAVTTQYGSELSNGSRLWTWHGGENNKTAKIALSFPEAQYQAEHCCCLTRGSGWL